MTPERRDADLDALRRRLYGPDATPEDVARYLERSPGPTLATDLPSAPQPDDGRPTRRPRHLPLVLAGTLLVAALVPLAVLVDSGARTPPSPAPSPPVRVEDVGEGEVLRVVTGAAGASSRTVTSIRGVQVEARRVSGTGSAVVPVPRTARPGTGGRVRVILSAPGAVVRWRALLVVRGDDRTSYPVVLARGVADGPSSAGASGTFVYAEDPPTRVAVAAPRGARWTMVVAVRPGLREASD